MNKEEKYHSPDNFNMPLYFRVEKETSEPSQPTQLSKEEAELIVLS